MASVPTSPVPPLRVLVVDDSADCADSLTMLLRLWGHEPAAAYGGPEALAAAADFRPDVALLDIELPGTNGYDVARRLRGLPGLAGVVLVALTCYGDEPHRRQSDGAGFAFYFVKPADPGDLKGLLGALAREGEAGAGVVAQVETFPRGTGEAAAQGERIT